MKFLAAILTIAFALSVCGGAAARQDLRNPDQVAPALEVLQDLRNPDQVTPVRGHVQDLRNPDQVSPAPGFVVSASTTSARAGSSSDAIVVPDGGLSTLAIVLIAAGGAVAVAGAGFGAMRVVHAHGHATA